jgi:hypothetical protein
LPSFDLMDFVKGRDGYFEVTVSPKTKHIHLIIGRNIMGAVAGIVGSVVSKVGGGAITSLAGNLLGKVMDKFGGKSVAGAMTNIFMGHAGGALKGLVAGAPIPGFLKGAVSSLIDKVIGQQRQQVPAECEGHVHEHYNDNLKECADQCVGQIGKELEGKTGGNWLLALAGALSNIQNKFLDAAMDSMKKMEQNVDGATAGGKGESEGAGNGGSEGAGNGSESAEKTKRNEFTLAQNEYQANMQMFNMFTNMSATTLKSIGEGMTALARKQ